MKAAELRDLDVDELGSKERDLADREQPIDERRAPGRGGGGVRRRHAAILLRRRRETAWV